MDAISTYKAKQRAEEEARRQQAQKEVPEVATVSTAPPMSIYDILRTGGR